MQVGYIGCAGWLAGRGTDCLHSTGTPEQERALVVVIAYQDLIEIDIQLMTLASRFLKKKTKSPLIRKKRFFDKENDENRLSFRKIREKTFFT